MDVTFRTKEMGSARETPLLLYIRLPEKPQTFHHYCCCPYFTSWCSTPKYLYWIASWECVTLFSEDAHNRRPKWTQDTQRCPSCKCIFKNCIGAVNGQKPCKIAAPSMKSLCGDIGGVQTEDKQRIKLNEAQLLLEHNAPSSSKEQVRPVKYIPRRFFVNAKVNHIFTLCDKTLLLPPFFATIFQSCVLSECFGVW